MQISLSIWEEEKVCEYLATWRATWLPKLEKASVHLTFSEPPPSFPQLKGDYAG